jgi:SAM-dependent methyltransferase
MPTLGPADDGNLDHLAPTDVPGGPRSSRTSFQGTNDGFRSGTEEVDLHCHDIPSLKASFLINNLPSTGRLLEVGSGGGKLLRTIRRHRSGLELFGCDIRNPAAPPEGYTFRLLDSPTLPYATGSMDSIVLFDVLEHVHDPVGMLHEIDRVLAPGGCLVAFIPTEGERLSAYAAYRRLLGQTLYVRTKDHVQRLTHADVDALLQDAGLKVETRSYAYHFLGQTMDATVYALTIVPSISRLFWRENCYYNAQTNRSAVGRVLNAALRVANALAWRESQWLHRVQRGSAGELLVARSAS